MHPVRWYVRSPMCHQEAKGSSTGSRYDTIPDVLSFTEESYPAVHFLLALVVSVSNEPQGGFWSKCPLQTELWADMWLN